MEDHNLTLAGVDCNDVQKLKGSLREKDRYVKSLYYKYSVVCTLVLLCFKIFASIFS